MTFHLGDERSWAVPEQQDIAAHNWGELVKVVTALRQQGTLSNHPSVAGYLERRRADLV